MASSSPSLAFRSWDTAAAASTAPALLKDTLARVNAERGHFRDISEFALVAEIEAAAAPSRSSPSSEDGDGDGDGDGNGDDTSETSVENDDISTTSQPKNVAELYTAKNEMLSNITAAQQEIMMALDFVSLLSTAHIPAAATTISPMLKQSGIPMGSLGVDFWRNMAPDTAREEEEERLATAVRFSQLRESADDLLAAAERLEGNVKRERVFWEQILGIEERGWRVSRIPRAQGLLGVHFGFNGAVREFAERDLAALVAGEQHGDEGGIVLETGVGTKAKGVRVVVRKDGKVVGCSRLSGAKSDGEGEKEGEKVGLEVRIRAARDSLFDEELQHEMVREARGLLALGVEMKGNLLSFPSAEQTIELELISLEEDNTLPPDSLHHSDHLAQAILLAARLLLSHSHRETLARKSQPSPPMSDKKETEKPVLALLRPILRILKHTSDISSLNAYLTNLDTLLGNADIETTLSPAKFTPSLPTSTSSTAANLITSLLQPLHSIATIAIPGPDNSSLTLEFTVETSPSTDSYILTHISEEEKKAFTLSTLPDLFEAADDSIAAELVSRLHTAAPVEGAMWELDKREGVLVRLGKLEEEGREVFRCGVRGEEGRMELRVEGEGVGEGGKCVVWGLEREHGGGRRSLWEAWGEICLEGEQRVDVVGKETS